LKGGTTKLGRADLDGGRGGRKEGARAEITRKTLRSKGEKKKGKKNGGGEGEKKVWSSERYHERKAKRRGKRV